VHDVAPRRRPGHLPAQARPEAGTAREVASAFPDVDLIAPAVRVALRRGHTWFENEGIGAARPERVAVAAERLLAWCDEEPLRGRPVWLCGFSNSGTLAAHLLIRHPDRFRGAALVSVPFVLRLGERERSAAECLQLD